MCICDKVSFRMGGGGDMLKILFYMWIKYKSFNDTIYGNIMFVQKQSQIPPNCSLIKGPKSKFPGGACPPKPLVCHMF